MGKLFFIVVLFCLGIGNTFAAQGYTLPDYHRILTNGKAVNMNLGIYPDGTFFLKLKDVKYTITDLKAFSKGATQALEETQMLQEGRQDRVSSIDSGNDVTTDKLFSSQPKTKGEERNFFTITFERHERYYPIKITFYRAKFKPESFDFPPGELQYLRNRIKIISENKGEYLTRARASVLVGE